VRRLRTLSIDDPLAPLPADAPTRPGADRDGHAPEPRLDEAGGLAPAARGSRSAPDNTQSPAPADRPTNDVHPPSDMFADRVAGGRLQNVAIDAIIPNRQQPRSRFDNEAIQALADSIADRGVLQPPVVRRTDDGTYELIAGERRWRAARRAGLTELAVLVTVADDRDALQDAVMENVLREDLSPVEQARAYATLIEDLGITREELGRRVGQSRVSISNHLRLLDLPDDVLELLDSGALSFAHGRALLLCDEHATRRQLAHRAVREDWSKRQLEAAARQAGAPRARRSTPSQSSADHQALAGRLGEAVSRATGVDVFVRASGRSDFTFTVKGQQAARDLARQLGAPDLEQPL
jgi:ParB family chromosome partitioning protein